MESRLGSGQIAMIAQEVARFRGNSPEADSFLTFEDPADPSKWVQITLFNVNAAYPFSDPPQSRLSPLGVTEVDEWEAGLFVTCSIDFSDLHRVAELVDRYFREVLGCRDNYQITTRIEL